MKIKKGLNQFENMTTLFAVAGDRSAKFFVASSGEINQVAKVDEIVPKYDDNEGFFGGKKGGKNGRMGSPNHEVPKEYLLKKFAGMFEEKVEEVWAEDGALPIYLFAPAFIHSLLIKALPKAMSKQIKMVINGNHLHAKPFDLLEMIDKKIPKGAPVTNEKARKLLKK